MVGTKRPHPRPLISSQHQHQRNRAKAAIEQMRAAGLISLPADGEEGAGTEKKKRPVYGKKKKVS